MLRAVSDKVSAFVKVHKVEISAAVVVALTILILYGAAYNALPKDHSFRAGLAKQWPQIVTVIAGMILGRLLGAAAHKVHENLKPFADGVDTHRQALLDSEQEDSVDAYEPLVGLRHRVKPESKMNRAFKKHAVDLIAFVAFPLLVVVLGAAVKGIRGQWKVGVSGCTGMVIGRLLAKGHFHYWEGVKRRGAAMLERTLFHNNEDSQVDKNMEANIPTERALRTITNSGLVKILAVPDVTLQSVPNRDLVSFSGNTITLPIDNSNILNLYIPNVKAITDDSTQERVWTDLLSQAQNNAVQYRRQVQAATHLSIILKIENGIIFWLKQVSNQRDENEMTHHSVYGSSNVAHERFDWVRLG